MEKLKGNKLTRQQERAIFEKGVAKRIAKFIELTGIDLTQGRSGRRSGYPRWNESILKKELEAFVHGSQAAEPSKDLGRRYPKGQSCIEKLLLVCFCLRVPARKTFAMIAPLLSKRVSAANIEHVATNLDRELARYYPSRPHKLGSLLHSMKRDQTTGRIAPHRELKNLYPTTMSELEEELDLLLASLRSVEPDLWNQLETAGLVKEARQRPAPRAKGRV